MHAIQNKFDGLYWSGRGFDNRAWDHTPETYETRDEAKEAMKTATLYGAPCRIVEVE